MVLGAVEPLRAAMTDDEWSDHVETSISVPILTLSCLIGWLLAPNCVALRKATSSFVSRMGSDGSRDRPYVRSITSLQFQDRINARSQAGKSGVGGQLIRSVS